jgi:hypothetical protein
MKLSQAILYAILATTAALAAPVERKPGPRPGPKPGPGGTGPAPAPSPGPGPAPEPHPDPQPQQSKPFMHSRRHSVDPVQEPPFSSGRNEAKLSIGRGRQHRHTHSKLVQTPEHGDQEGLEVRAFFEVDELD